VVETLYEQATVAYKAYRSGHWPLKQSSGTRDQADARVLHLAGASNLHYDACTPTSASSPVGVPPAIQPESIHPTLFEYLQVIQREDTEVEESPDIYTTESASSEKLNDGAPGGRRIEKTSSSALNSLEIFNGAAGPSPSSRLPLFQTQAGNPSWLPFESAQTPVAQGTAVQSNDPPFDPPPAFDSIFRFQHPSISTQHSQFSDGISGPQLASAVGPSLTPDGSGNFGIGMVQMGDPNAGDGMDFTRFVAENVPGLVYSGNGMGWDTFLTGWQTQC